ncbi:MAG: hypothetical protein IPK27_12905 [Rhodanobacteraceae bacterium]|nr:hypothetical protein [Rhodanobacteraceae bacterium]
MSEHRDVRVAQRALRFASTAGTLPRMMRGKRDVWVAFFGDFSLAIKESYSASTINAVALDLGGKSQRRKARSQKLAG